ncbi:hypothetical protein [Planktothrix sp. FACHB-1365]|uniref:hypothetical protein n=1 Tax=Planktothrix sp. FACHB-1365 TaxID=2692855 RepID=UPI0016857EF8|nr:hypothetical protein [Planktothrix sp. FACHB-1365]MBD2483972.1 hypothetical protein [Planktothrix sp. FACHB-1365]
MTAATLASPPAHQVDFKLPTHFELSDSFSHNYDYSSFGELAPLAQQTLNQTLNFVQRTLSEGLELGRQLSQLLSNLCDRTNPQDGQKRFKNWLNSSDWGASKWIAESLIKISQWFDSLKPRLQQRILNKVQHWSLAALRELTHASEAIVEVLTQRGKITKKEVRKAKAEQIVTEQDWQKISKRYNLTPQEGQHLQTLAQEFAQADTKNQAEAVIKLKHLDEALAQKGYKTSSPIPQQPSETALRLARLTLHKVQLEQELSEAVTGDAQAQLIYDIKQTEREIKHLCAHLDPQTIVIPPQPQSPPADDLEAALATERQKNAELMQKLEHLEQKLSQTYLQQLDQLQTQLQQKDELIAQLQQPTSSPDNEPTVFKPKFVPVPLSELKPGDRIRVYSPEHKGVVDDLILELDTYNRPKTKWLGVLDQNDVKAGWTFERMSGVEQAQSQLSLLKSENQHLKQQLAQQQQDLETLLSEPSHVRLEQTSTTQQLEVQIAELLQWRESLNQQIQPDLQPGVKVRVNFDPKNIFTGMQGIIHKAYQQRPGYWWVSITHPVSGQTYHELFEPCQLQPLV